MAINTVYSTLFTLPQEDDGWQLVPDAQAENCEQVQTLVNDVEVTTPNTGPISKPQFQMMLRKFLEHSGICITADELHHIQLEGVQFELWDLHLEVMSRGMRRKVESTRAWPLIAANLGFPVDSDSVAHIRGDPTIVRQSTIRIGRLLQQVHIRYLSQFEEAHMQGQVAIPSVGSSDINN